MENQVKKDVLFRVIAESRGFDEFDRVEKKVKKLGNAQQQATEIFEKNEGAQKRVLEVTKKRTKSGGQQTVVNERLIKQQSRFRMEFLGVMFAGMALQRAFAGLTQTAKDWMGVGEIMSTTMGIVMLPAVSELMEKGVLPLSEALMGLSENAQMAIGVTALSFEAVGGAVMGLGQIGLAGNALEQMFPKQIAKAGGAGVIIKGAVGLAIGITGLTILAGGIKESDLQQELIGAFVTGIGASFIAASVGASIAGAMAIGAITAALAINVALSVNYIKKSQDKRKALQAAGFSGEETDQIMRREVTAQTGSLLPSIISRTTGVDAETAALATTGVTQTPFLSLIGNLFKNRGSRAVGGNIPQTGLFMMHEGEQVLRKDQAGQGQNINISYTVNATNMREVESMLRESERRVTSDIRRLSR